jgi:hypothetical protein
MLTKSMLMICTPRGSYRVITSVVEAPTTFTFANTSPCYLQLLATAMQRFYLLEERFENEIAVGTSSSSALVTSARYQG